MVYDSLLDSTYSRQANVSKFVGSGIVDARVLSEVIVGGRAIDDETALWDFKKQLPVLPAGVKLSASAKRGFDAKFAEIVKDCVAFYNAHGGYLIVGIDDDSREIVGFEESFDYADLNKRIQAATQKSIETVYRTLDFEVQGASKKLGLLFIPRRPDSETPVRFESKATESENGRVAYRPGDYFVRERDNSCPATTPDHMEFLFGKRRRSPGGAIHEKIELLENNLPARDPDFGPLIGREPEVAELWLWLTDVFSPVKILCGLGGVGKTSIAYTFAERLICESPSLIQKVVWLGAKQRTFSANLGKFIATSRVDFDSVDGFLQELLLELGCPPDQIPEEPSQNQLLALVDSHLGTFNYLVVIDDLDSLDDSDQQHLFYLVTQLFSRSKSKAIITARRNLGTSKPTHREIEGLDRSDFDKFVEEKANLLGISSSVYKKPSLLDKLFKESGGSPLFVLSVLRLVSLGDDLNEAIKNWAGSDGDQVREAAFKREVGRLQPDQARVLLALCYFKEASVVELRAALDMSRFQVQSALEALQAFSMTTRGRDLPGGATLEVPRTLRLMTPLIEKRVSDFKKIKSSCDEIRKASTNSKAVVSEAVGRSIAFLKQGDPKSATETVEKSLSVLPNNPDLLCLLGRCLAESGPSMTSRAEEAFAQAREHGCGKRELFDQWIQMYESRSDWKRIPDLTRDAEKRCLAVRYPISRNQAYLSIGDGLASAGQVSGAEEIYLQAVEDLKAAYNVYTYKGDREQIRSLQERAIVRWLGSVGVLGKESNQQRRFFGACVRALKNYGFYDARVLMRALDQLESWFEQVRRRVRLSETAREQLSIEANRLNTLERLLCEQSRTDHHILKQVQRLSARLRDMAGGESEPA